MKVIIAPDKFKDSLSSIEVCVAMKKGILSVFPEARVVPIPLADGGEGTFDMFAWHTKAAIRKVMVRDPLMREIEAKYALSRDGQTAFIEMAKASGLELLKPAERACVRTSSYGTGQLIRAAVEAGAQKLVLGIGGSATCDAGMGMAAALGFQFLDQNGTPLEPIGGNMRRVQAIVRDQLAFDPANLSIEVACDVDNPLYGPKGAAYVYGPQKGAEAAELAELDGGLRHMNELWQQTLDLDLAERPGAGAAGGIGGGAVAFLGASLRPGIELLMAQTSFAQEIEEAELVITGEGKIDEQTLHGKVIWGVCQAARAHHVPVIGICGTLAATPEQVQSLGLASAHSILNAPMDLATAQEKAAQLVEEQLHYLLSLWKVGKS